VNFEHLHSHGLAGGHCHCRCQTLWLTDQTAFADEFVRSQDRDDGFLTLFGDNGDFDFSAFDVEDGIRGVALLPLTTLRLAIFRDYPTQQLGCLSEIAHIFLSVLSPPTEPASFAVPEQWPQAVHSKKLYLRLAVS